MLPSLGRIWHAILPLALAGAVGASASYGPSATGARTLVVLPDGASPDEYSALTTHLSAKGYDLSFRTPLGGALDGHASADLTLERWGSNQFDHILQLAPHLGGDLTPQKLVTFLQRGGNAVLAYDPSSPDTYRDFAHEFHVSLSSRGEEIKDHFRSLHDHAGLLVGGPAQKGIFPGGVVENEVIFSPATVAAIQKYPIVYNGVAHSVSDLPLGFPLLLAPGTAYTQVEGDVLAGPDAVLASAFQVKDVSSRVLFLGSTEMVKDAAVKATALQSLSGEEFGQSANLAFLSDALAWTMQETGVVRVGGTAHHRVHASDDSRPIYEEDDEGNAMYRIKDTVEYSIDLQLFTPFKGWGPAPTTLGAQVSLIMLDPYVVAPLKATADADKTRYSTQVQLPDRHGVFTFSVDWKRFGYSYVEAKDTAPVRPFNSDEYPRWLSAAYPYAAGAISTLTAFTAFAALWLFTPYEAQKTKSA